ncbi:hypothetical protein J4E93_003794 [Alternaria ventricosa]|uniref:uncharacterized protein n=1 Tax=Alternaria ventricosa TaxID=1187951 RepID=UPI0020C42B12|nr:uncharacterized protein J4E93_003794 [Alternaria ventricosa]KAI4649474.1 hypothetical protein J4E93_003794 [Alternaria ventricosa]
MRPSLRPLWLPQTSFLARLPRTTPHRVPRRIATTSARNAAPIDLPKLRLSPGSLYHDSLTTFLEYAKETNLNLTSTLAIGTIYEYMSAQALMRLGFSLLRIGRMGDAGIDLIGHWVLGPLREPMPVIVQCKARSNSVNPKHIRELEGSFQGVPPHWRNKDVLGLLVTTKKATTGVMKAIANSSCPMGFILISREGLVEQFVWNRAATERGLQGVSVTVRHTPRALLEDPEEGLEEDTKVSKKSQDKFKTSGTMKDIQLTWMGSPIFPDRDNLDQETLKLMRQIPANIVHVPAPVVEVEEPPQGHSKGSVKDKKKATPVVAPKLGRPLKKWSEKVPHPRGGQISGTLKKPTEGHTLGRPPGSKTKRRAGDEPAVVEKPPRPPKDPHRHKKLRQQIPTCRPRLGRPPGSKNKPKVPVDTG